MWDMVLTLQNIYMCARVYNIYIHICIYIYLFICIYTYIGIYIAEIDVDDMAWRQCCKICTCVHVCICIRIYLYVYIHIYNIYIYIYACVYT